MLLESSISSHEPRSTCLLLHESCSWPDRPCEGLPWRPHLTVLLEIVPEVVAQGSSGPALFHLVLVSSELSQLSQGGSSRSKVGVGDKQFFLFPGSYLGCSWQKSHSPKHPWIHVSQLTSEHFPLWFIELCLHSLLALMADNLDFRWVRFLWIGWLPIEIYYFRVFF